MTPQGLLQFHLPAVMALHGRWALFVAMAWMQGLLLQVRLASSTRAATGWLCMPAA
jgi:hypothetical protein